MVLVNRDERERFLTTLREDEGFRAAVRRELLTDELLALPEKVAALTATVDALSATVDALSATVNALSDTVNALSDTVNALSATVSTLVDVVAEQQRDLRDLKQGLADLTAHTMQTFTQFQAAMASGFAALQAQLAADREQNQAGFTALTSRLDHIDSELTDIRGQLAS
jgi:ABC-type transporter Mla subunit MlaD